MRFTERFLLPFFGPAELGSQQTVTPAPPQARDRDQSLRSGMTRVVGADGRAFLVANDPPRTPDA